MTEVKERPLATPVDVAPRNDRELVIARLIEASPEALYRCWTDPEILPKWFAPRPLTTEVREMDVRPGGRQAIVMKTPDGTEHETGGVYLELVPGRKVVSTDAFREAWVPGEGTPFMVAEITFEPQPDGRTLYTARAGHWDEASKQRHEEMGFHQGWGLCAEQLAEVARTL